MMQDKLKSLAGDAAIYGFFQIVGRFLTFLLTPLYTNYLTMNEVGEIGNIYAIIAFVNIIYSFGMESSFFKFYSKEDTEHSKKVFTHTFMIIFSIAAFCSFGTILLNGVLSPYIISLPRAGYLLTLTALIPFLDAVILIPYALLRMTRRAKRFAMTRFALIMISVALNFLFVVFIKMGAEGVLLANIIASFVGVILFLPEIMHHIKFKFDLPLFKEIFKFGLPTMPSNLSAMILQVADRPMLKALSTDYNLSLYTVNYRLGIPMMIMVTVFDYAWKPFYLSHSDDEDAKELFARVFTYFTIICAAIFLIAGFYMDFVVRFPFIGGKFINPKYWPGLSILPLVLGGLYFNGASSNFAAGFLITKNTKYIPFSVGFAAGISLLLNFVLIPVLGFRGPAISILVGYFLGAMILYIFQKNIYPIPYEWKRIITLVCLTPIFYILGTSVSSYQVLSAYISSPNMAMLASFIIRTAVIGAFVFTLKLFGFFTQSEINRIKSIINKFKKRK